jgi:hypothetical protein
LREHIEEQAHAAEVDLKLGAGLAVGHSDRDRRATEAELADAEAVQCPVGHRHSPTPEQAVDLGQP